MATTKQLTTEIIKDSQFGKGSSDSATLTKMFKNAPQYKGYKPEVVTRVGNALLKSAQVGDVTVDDGGSVSAVAPKQGFYTFSKPFNRDYTDTPEIDNSTIKTGKEGLPGTAHSPNPDISGELEASEVEKLKGGGGAFNGVDYGGDPAGEAAEIAVQEIGNLQLGDHEPGAPSNG